MTTLGDERYDRMLRQMIEGQAYRELAAARLFGHGLSYAPGIGELRFLVWHIREEAEHYEAVAEMYQGLTGTSVEPLVAARLRDRPMHPAGSWYELAMAQFLYDRGGFWQLREYEECSFAPYRRVVEKIVREERGHQAFGERMVVTLTRSGDHEAHKQPIFERWLRHGLLSFGRPGTEASRWAVGAGLKKRDPGAVMADFLADIKPAVKACGLMLPSLGRLAIDAPAEGLDLSLDGVDETRAEGWQN
jgi:1,2-phenylacetyl-CoA epoxidase catalytic subunit